MTARLSSHTAQRVVKVDLPVEACEKLIEQALTEFGATRVHRTREKTHALIYHSLVEAGQQSLAVEATPLAAGRCRVQIVSRPAAPAPKSAAPTEAQQSTVDGFERLLKRVIGAHLIPA